MTSCPVAGPTLLAQRIRRDGDHSACARWALGMCSAMVRRLAVVAAPVRGDALVAAEDLDRVRRVADFDLLAQQLVRDAVEVVLDLDVVVDVNAAPLPLREDVARGGQGSQRRAVELLVQRAAADAQLLHRPVVQLVEQDADRGR